MFCFTFNSQAYFQQLNFYQFFRGHVKSGWDRNVYWNCRNLPQTILREVGQISADNRQTVCYEAVCRAESFFPSGQPIQFVIPISSPLPDALFLTSPRWRKFTGKWISYTKNGCSGDKKWVTLRLSDILWVTMRMHKSPIKFPRGPKSIKIQSVFFFKNLSQLVCVASWNSRRTTFFGPPQPRNHMADLSTLYGI